MIKPVSSQKPMVRILSDMSCLSSGLERVQGVALLL
jgi:hypothetical protein